jgi:uncharacterized membrane protein
MRPPIAAGHDPSIIFDARPLCGKGMASVDELNTPLRSGLLLERTARVLAKPAALFVLLSLVFGTLTLILTPPLRAPDEPAHFFRIYAMAQGEIIPVTADAQGRKGMLLPGRLYQDFEFFESRRLSIYLEGFSYRRVPAEYRKRPRPDDGPPTFVYYAGSEGYNPISYLPFIAAALLARAVDLDFLATFWLMRFAGLLAMTAVIAYAIAIVPRLGWTFLFIAMLPASLYARAVISPDGAALAYTMVVAALCLRAAYGLDAEKLWQQSLWMTLCALPKPPQLAFILLAAIRARPAQLLSQWGGLAWIVAPAVIFSVLWVTWGSIDIAAWRYYEGSGIPKEQFEPLWKLRYMLEHPWHFPTQIWPNIREIDWLWEQLIGVLGWLDTRLRDWVYPVLGILLVAVAFIRLDIDRAFRLWIALVAALTVFGYVLATYLVFYLAWTPIESDQVQGVQGRYFVMALPVAALLLAALVNRAPPAIVTAFLAVAGAILSGGAVIEAILRVDWPPVGA